MLLAGPKVKSLIVQSMTTALSALRTLASMSSSSGEARGEVRIGRSRPD